MVDNRATTRIRSFSGDSTGAEGQETREGVGKTVHG